MNCPDCSTWLAKNATSCRCGWESAPKGKFHPLGYPQCAWEADGMRCKFPGSMTSSTQADDSCKWFCSAHFNCLDPRAGGAVVQASQDYRHVPKDVRQLNVDAARFCRENGLNTVDEMRAFCLARMPKIGRKAA
jgi:hypothetical protein